MTPIRRRLSGSLRVAQRYVKDVASGTRFATRLSSPFLPIRAEIQQKIRRTESFAAKHHNISKGAACLHGLILAPNEVFSFWKLVGQPSHKRDFLPSRSLVNGRAVLDDGGGLCQLAGILYHLSLVCGLDVLERHAHSRDLYTEEDRFTPLGADAAVAFGHKDLRLRNPYASPLQFLVEVGAESLSAMLCAEMALDVFEVSFVRLPDEGQIRKVETFALKANETAPKWIATSSYRID